ncbi:penicillin-binding protein activator [Erythrobacter sp. HL-111]|uniref:penicillin-binding protein activator n=1 Tax=Erythrobacter sp. HL-111 TaxID=1798193 RepID=UPI0006D9E574|nr:penicillin-binding protein activator [Erythrobacter sp. HL-111]KPP86396.1 MAG: amino acid/amide ABC transporter substrate-binding protein, HAAT family [Erythrobacteraceae bacterium HL-111]SDR93873.1 amino acid/amide ABC transporter substrate-binding protein, HAAT family [Erythrobacter sp. HL-111]
MKVTGFARGQAAEAAVGVCTGLRAAARVFNRRTFALAGCAALLAGCQLIPKTETVSTGPEPSTPTPEPSETALPSDEQRHRVALLVPMGGSTGEVGQSLANATTMALLDTNANTLRITTYDTSAGAGEAARRAIADGNRLILGPLLAANVPAVQAAARPAGVTAISFSNDVSAASADVLLMGHIPEQSIERTVRYARENGSNAFAALVPEGDYGQRSYDAMRRALDAFGGNLVATERYSRGNTSIISAARRLREDGGYDTVLIADGPRAAVQSASEIKRDGAEGTRLLGTELWSGEGSLTRAPAVEGAIFSAVTDDRFQRFADSYESRFGGKPYRIATLGYDAVLLTLRMAQDWRIGDPFPRTDLYGRTFIGIDGAFRFRRSGVAERALEVRKVTGGRIVEVEPAPTSF